MTNSELFKSKTLDGYVYRARLIFRDWIINKLNRYAGSIHWKRRYETPVVKPTMPYPIFRLLSFIEYNLRANVWQKRYSDLVDLITYGEVIPERGSREWFREQQMKRVTKNIQLFNTIGVTAKIASENLKKFGQVIGRVGISAFESYKNNKKL